MISCPECDAILEFEQSELEEGDTVNCEECGASLVVVATDPELELAVDADGGLDDEEDLDEDDEFADEDEDSEEDDDEEDEEDWR